MFRKKDPRKALVEKKVRALMKAIPGTAAVDPKNELILKVPVNTAYQTFFLIVDISNEQFPYTKPAVKLENSRGLFHPLMDENGVFNLPEFDHWNVHSD